MTDGTASVRWNKRTNQPHRNLKRSSEEKSRNVVWRITPGKDGRIFSQDHPYFPKSCSKCPFNKGFKNRVRTFFKNEEKDCYECAQIDSSLPKSKYKTKNRAKEIREEAAFLRKQVLVNNEFPHDVTISQKKIKEWLNQPHKFYEEKNELLLELPKVFRRAKYLGSTKDPKERPGVVKSHIFEIELCGEPSYIIVHEMKWNEYQLHSISDYKII